MGHKKLYPYLRFRLKTIVYRQKLEGASSLVLSVEDDVGIRTIVDELMSTSKHSEAGMRRVSIELLLA